MRVTLERGLVRTGKERNKRERGAQSLESARWLKLVTVVFAWHFFSAERASGGGCVYEQGPPGDLEVWGQRAGHSLPGEGTWREDGTPGGVAKGAEAASFDGCGPGYEGDARE